MMEPGFQVTVWLFNHCDLPETLVLWGGIVLLTSEPSGTFTASAGFCQLGWLTWSLAKEKVDKISFKARVLPRVTGCMII